MILFLSHIPSWQKFAGVSCTESRYLGVGLATMQDDKCIDRQRELCDSLAAFGIVTGNTRADDT